VNPKAINDRARDLNINELPSTVSNAVGRGQTSPYCAPLDVSRATVTPATSFAGWADRIRRSRKHCEIISVVATVYVETTIVGYMAARPRPDVVLAAHQAMTRT
jgi:hypothetical protein